MEPDKREQALRTLLMEKETEEEILEQTDEADVIKEDGNFVDELINNNPTVQKIEELLKEKRKLSNQLLQQQSKDTLQMTNANVASNEQEICMQQESQDLTESEFQTENLDFHSKQPAINEEKITQVKPKRSKKFRKNLILIASSIVLCLCIGWTIGNAIAINNQATALNLAKSNYEVNLAQYTMKIARLDGVEISDDTNEFSPITSAIELSPLPLSQPTDYTKSSNWFDKLCNWLSTIFRR